MLISASDYALITSKLYIYSDLLKRKKIFITGGTGFFGKWILKTVSILNCDFNLDIKLVILSRDPEMFISNFYHLYESEKISFIQGDIRTFNYPLDEFDYIIHAATDASAVLNKENPKLMQSTIMEGARHIADFSNKVKCKRFLYTSSGAAYGPQPIKMKKISENYLDNPYFNHNDAYASAKLASEKYLKDNLKSDLLIARCFTFSGPYLPLNGSYAFGNFINNRIKNKNIQILSTGQSLRSYLYAADLVIWLFTILLRGEDRDIYNVGSDESISISELAKKIAGDDLEIKFGNDTSMNIYVPDVSKCRNELGLEIYTSLDNAITKTLKYYG